MTSRCARIRRCSVIWAVYYVACLALITSVHTQQDPRFYIGHSDYQHGAEWPSQPSARYVSAQRSPLQDLNPFASFAPQQTNAGPFSPFAVRNSYQVQEEDQRFYRPYSGPTSYQNPSQTGSGFSLQKSREREFHVSDAFGSSTLDPKFGYDVQLGSEQISKKQKNRIDQGNNRPKFPKNGEILPKIEKPVTAQVDRWNTRSDGEFSVQNARQNVRTDGTLSESNARQNVRADGTFSELNAGQNVRVDGTFSEQNARQNVRADGTLSEPNVRQNDRPRGTFSEPKSKPKTTTHSTIKESSTEDIFSKQNRFSNVQRSPQNNNDNEFNSGDSKSNFSPDDYSRESVNEDVDSRDSLASSTSEPNLAGFNHHVTAKHPDISTQQPRTTKLPSIKKQINPNTTAVFQPTTRRPNEQALRKIKNLESGLEPVKMQARIVSKSRSNQQERGHNADYDVVQTKKQNKEFVSENNFKEFADTSAIDVVDPLISGEDVLESEDEAAEEEDRSNLSTSTARPPSTTAVTSTTTTSEASTAAATTKVPSTTEGWIIVASVQTSRSVSGARFIPSSAITQEQYPKPLDAKEPLPKVRSNQTDSRAGYKTKSKQSTATTPSAESIIEKLDQMQSDLSSGILAGKYSKDRAKSHLEIVPELSTGKTTKTTVSQTTAITASPSTTTTTESSEEESEPFIVRKFTPSSKRSSSAATPKPKSDKKSILDSIQLDDLTGLLPAGFKVRGFTPKNAHTTTSKSSTTAVSTTEGSKTSLATLKNKLKIKFDDVSALLPPGYKPPPDEGESVKSDQDQTPVSTDEKPISKAKEILSVAKPADISAFLPPGYKPPDSTAKSSTAKSSLSKIKFEEVSDLLPPGFKPSKDETEGETSDSANSSIIPSILSKIKFKEVDNLLPPGFKPPKDEDQTPKNEGQPPNENLTSSTSSEGVVIGEGDSPPSSTSSKVVFPSRPVGPPRKKPPPSTPIKVAQPSGGLLPHQVPVIQKGWPIRATTEFNGWPSPSPVPISIEKLLEQSKEAAIRDKQSETSSKESNEAAATSTTVIPTSSTTTRKPTTPGICSEDCELAGTIRITEGVKWVPELLDHNTKEFRSLASDLQQQLNSVYQNSESLSRWYKKITIDAFAPGSVIVDYFVEMSELGRTVNTADMKRFLHETLLQETIIADPTYLLTANQTKHRHYKLGKYTIDPVYTDFVVLPKAAMPVMGMMDQDMILPQWAIAVVVVALASLLFVFIFGITVLVNRAKNSKHPTALTEDMLNELNKNHMSGGGFHDSYGADELYNMEDVWNEKPTKKRSYYQESGLSRNNLYDSWRSDWNGYNGGSHRGGKDIGGYYGGSHKGGKDNGGYYGGSHKGGKDDGEYYGGSHKGVKDYGEDYGGSQYGSRNVSQAKSNTYQQRTTTASSYYNSFANNSQRASFTNQQSIYGRRRDYDDNF